jgi:hypothetical protein
VIPALQSPLIVFLPSSAIAVLIYSSYQTFVDGGSPDFGNRMKVKRVQPVESEWRTLNHVRWTAMNERKEENCPKSVNKPLK